MPPCARARRVPFRPPPPLLDPDEPLVIMDRASPAERAFYAGLPWLCPALVPFAGYCGDLTRVRDPSLCAQVLTGGCEENGEGGRGGGGARNADAAESGVHPPDSAICIQNPTHGFRRPCVLYVRVNTADVLADNGLRHNGTANVVMAKLYNASIAAFEDLPARARDTHSSCLSQVIDSYLGQAGQAGGSEYVEGLLAGFKEELEALASAARSAEVRLGNCVIAMVYEADPPADVAAPDVPDSLPAGRAPPPAPGDDAESDDEPQSMLDVKLLDFRECVWCQGEGPDERFLRALDEIASSLSAIR